MPQSSPLDFEYKLIINSSIKTVFRFVFTIFECIQQNVLNMSSFWFVETWTSRCCHPIVVNQSYFAASHVLRLFRIIRLFLSDLWATDIASHTIWQSKERTPQYRTWILNGFLLSRYYVVLWLLHNVNFIVVDEYWRKVLFIEP